MLCNYNVVFEWFLNQFLNGCINSMDAKRVFVGKYRPYLIIIFKNIFLRRVFKNYYLIFFRTVVVKHAHISITPT